MTVQELEHDVETLRKWTVSILGREARPIDRVTVHGPEETLLPSMD